MASSTFPPLWLTMAVACSLLLTSVHACVTSSICECKTTACHDNTKCDSTISVGGGNYCWPVAYCNIFGCNCDRCDYGCNLCIERYGRRDGYGGALPTNNSTNTDPCGDFKLFELMSVKDLMATLNNVYCKSANESVGYRFLAHVLNQVDTNKDGVITCKEYNDDQAANMDVVKRKPECKLKDGIHIKNAK